MRCHSRPRSLLLLPPSNTGRFAVRSGRAALSGPAESAVQRQFLSLRRCSPPLRECRDRASSPPLSSAVFRELHDSIGTAVSSSSSSSLQPPVWEGRGKSRRKPLLQQRLAALNSAAVPVLFRPSSSSSAGGHDSASFPLSSPVSVGSLPPFHLRDSPHEGARVGGGGGSWSGGAASALPSSPLCRVTRGVGETRRFNPTEVPRQHRRESATQRRRAAADASSGSGSVCVCVCVYARVCVCVCMRVQIWWAVVELRHLHEGAAATHHETKRYLAISWRLRPPTRRSADPAAVNSRNCFGCVFEREGVVRRITSQSMEWRKLRSLSRASTAVS